MSSQEQLSLVFMISAWHDWHLTSNVTCVFLGKVLSHLLETYKIGNVQVEQECTWLGLEQRRIWMSSSVSWKAHTFLARSRSTHNHRTQSELLCTHCSIHLRLLFKVFMKLWHFCRRTKGEKKTFYQWPTITPQDILFSCHLIVLMKVTMWLSMSTEITTSSSILCPTTDIPSDSTREFALLSGSHL